eukprot:230468-Hanusia_phi.AAC.4
MLLILTFLPDHRTSIALYACATCSRLPSLINNLVLSACSLAQVLLQVDLNRLHVSMCKKLVNQTRRQMPCGG